MRDDHEKFKQAGVQIAVVAKDSPETMKSYWKENSLPYAGIPDPEGKLAERYNQQWKLSKLGLMPAMFLIDTGGAIAFLHYSASMSDIPENAKVIQEATKLAK